MISSHELTKLTSILTNLPKGHGILGIYLSNGQVEMHLNESVFLELFPTYSVEPWTHGSYDSEISTVINEVKIFTLTNLLPEEK